MSDMNAEVRRIHELVGALSDAVWEEVRRRQRCPDFSPIAYIIEHYAGECRAKTKQEAEIWNHLTSSQNYDALVSYTEYWKSVGIDDHAARFHAAQLKKAGERRDDASTAGA